MTNGVVLFMGYGSEWIIFLAVIIYIILAACIASAFKEIAEMKGHDGKAVFWCTFVLGIVGMLMAVALPDRGTNENGSEVTAQGTQNQASNNAFDNEDLPDL